MEFIKFLGKAALNGKQIAIYRDNGNMIVSLETVGGKAIRYKADFGEGRQWLTLGKVCMTPAEFEEFEERMTAGIYGPSDARIVQRALVELGYHAENFGG